MRRYSLRALALFYLLAILVAPLAIVFWRTVEHGLSPAWNALSSAETIHALKLTLIITAIAVPVNTVFGVMCALAIVRRRFPGKGLLNAFIDLPLALSPVVVGLALYLLYGRNGWFGSWFSAHGIQVLFALPSMVIATRASISRAPTRSRSCSRSQPYSSSSLWWPSDPRRKLRNVDLGQTRLEAIRRLPRARRRLARGRDRVADGAPRAQRQRQVDP